MLHKEVGPWEDTRADNEANENDQQQPRPAISPWQRVSYSMPRHIDQSSGADGDEATADDARRLTQRTEDVIVVRQRRKDARKTLSEIFSHRRCGVDNTGNVRVWQAEEVMVHHIMRNMWQRDTEVALAGDEDVTEAPIAPAVGGDEVGGGDQDRRTAKRECAGATPPLAPRQPAQVRRHCFSGKAILELGGGMTGLAGLCAAMLPGVREVFVTDGNADAVQNLRVCVGVNVRREVFGETAVCARQLLWSTDTELGDTSAGSLVCRFDYALVCDCLFFEAHHHGLLHILGTTLRPGGEALLLQPSRGGSLERFVKLATSPESPAAGLFRVEVRTRFDDDVWRMHEAFVGEASAAAQDTTAAEYNPDIHLPVLVHMTRL